MHKTLPNARTTHGHLRWVAYDDEPLHWGVAGEQWNPSSIAEEMRYTNLLKSVDFAPFATHTDLTEVFIDSAVTERYTRHRYLAMVFEGVPKVNPSMSYTVVGFHLLSAGSPGGAPPKHCMYMPLGTKAGNKLRCRRLWLGHEVWARRPTSSCSAHSAPPRRRQRGRPAVPSDTRRPWVDRRDRVFCRPLVHRPDRIGGAPLEGWQRGAHDAPAADADGTSERLLARLAGAPTRVIRWRSAADESLVWRASRALVETYSGPTE